MPISKIPSREMITIPKERWDWQLSNFELQRQTIIELVDQLQNILDLPYGSEGYCKVIARNAIAKVKGENND